MARVEQARPALAEGVVLCGWQESAQRFLVQGPTGRAFMFRAPEYAVLRLLDGEATADEVAARASAALATGRQVSAVMVERFADRLAERGLLRGSEAAGGRELPPGWLEIDLSAATPVLRALSSVLFSRRSGLPLLVLVGLSLAFEGLAWGRTFLADLTGFLTWPASLVTVLAMYAWLPVLVAVHELGHVLAVLRFTGRVCALRARPLRLRAHVVVPPALIWGLRSRTRRVTVALGGIYLHLVGLAAAAAAYHAIGADPIRHVLTAAMLALACNVLLSAAPGRPFLPSRRSDGYFALGHVVGVPDLRQGPPAVHRAAAALAWLPVLVFAAAAALAVVAVPVGGFVVAIVLTVWAAGPYLSALVRRLSTGRRADRPQPRLVTRGGAQ